MVPTRPWLSVYQQRTIKRKLRTHTASELAAHYSCPLSEIFAARDGKPSALRLSVRAGYVPTPAEIRAACVQIQATWSRVEERKRRVGKPQHVDIQVIDSRKLLEA